MGFLTVNLKYLPPKLHYGLFFGGTGTIFPFMPVYAKVLGLSSRTVGTVFTILPLLGLLFKPIFGGIADKYKWHRGVLVLWDFLVMAAYFSIYFIPPPASVASGDNSESSFSQWQFWVFLVLLSLTWIGTAIVTTISDTITIEICGTELWGRQRYWGSIGWGVMAIITGALMDAFSTGDETNYAPAYYLLLVPLIIDIILCYFKMNISMPVQSENISKDVWRVLKKPRNAIFTLWCAAQGVSFGLLWNFLYWHLEELAEKEGISTQIKTIEGLLQGLQCFIGEGPAFFFSGWLVGKVGHSHAMSLVFLAIGIRFVLYSVLVNPWWAMPIEFFQNNYGIFYSAMTSYAKKVGPPGTEATIQSVLCAVCEGIGVALGSFIAGYVYDVYGGSYTFRSFGITFICLAATNEMIELYWRFHDRQLEAKANLPISNKEVLEASASDKAE